MSHKFNKISQNYWKKISQYAYDIEQWGSESGKKVEYLHVRVVNTDRWDNLRYSYVAINKSWW